VSNAGPDQAVSVGQTVTLNGGGSSDPDGNTLTYAWSLTAPAGSTATLSSVTAVQPPLVAGPTWRGATRHSSSSTTARWAARRIA
jgi:hypothetical protein